MQRKMYIQVRQAQMQDCEAIKCLAEANRDMAGLVCKQALAMHIACERVLILVFDQAIVGFLCYRCCRTSQLILQKLCIDFPYRDRGLELQLIRAFRGVAIARRKKQIYVKSSLCNPLNSVYQRASFELIAAEGMRPFCIWKLSWIGNF